MPASLTSTSIHLQVSAIRTRVFTAANTEFGFAYGKGVLGLFAGQAERLELGHPGR